MAVSSCWQAALSILRICVRQSVVKLFIPWLYLVHNQATISGRHPPIRSSCSARGSPSDTIATSDTNDTNDTNLTRSTLETVHNRDKPNSRPVAALHM